MACCVLLVRHIDENLVTPSDKFSYLSVTLDLVVTPSPARNDVIFLELRKVLDESVSAEDRYVVKPVVTWRSAEHDPLVSRGNLVERLDPSTGSNQSLLVEDEERILYLLILLDVFPGVDDG